MFCYSQLTLTVISVVRDGLEEMALFVTSHRNIAPSSCFLGRISSRLTVCPSLRLGRLVLPFISVPSERPSQEICGGGEPPALEQDRLKASPSTASKALERQELGNMSRGWNNSLSCSFAFTYILVWPIGGVGRQIPQLLPVFHIKHICNQVGNDKSNQCSSWLACNRMV